MLQQIVLSKNPESSRNSWHVQSSLLNSRNHQPAARRRARPAAAGGAAVCCVTMASARPRLNSIHQKVDSPNESECLLRNEGTALRDLETVLSES
jgi:hypothetical protein